MTQYLGIFTRGRTLVTQANGNYPCSEKRPDTLLNHVLKLGSDQTITYGIGHNPSLKEIPTVRNVAMKCYYLNVCAILRDLLWLAAVRQVIKFTNKTRTRRNFLGFTIVQTKCKYTYNMPACAPLVDTDYYGNNIHP